MGEGKGGGEGGRGRGEGKGGGKNARAHLLKMLESDGGNGGNHFWLGKILGHIGDLCLSVKKNYIVK